MLRGYCGFTASLSRINNFLFFYIFLLEGLVSPGHIFTWDVDLTYQNAGFLYKMDIYFSLESGLEEGNFLRVTFPDRGTIIDWASIVKIEEPFPSTNDLKISLTGSQGDYYFKPAFSLSANSWYVARVNFLDKYISSQTSGYKGVLSMETSSLDTSTSKIIYDSNSVAAVFQIAPKPSDNIKMSISYSSSTKDTEKTEFSRTNVVNFDITPSVSVETGAYIFINLESQKRWTFGSTCEISEKTCGTTETNCVSIEKAQGDCFITNSKEIKFTSSSELVNGKPLRIQVAVTNPPIFQDQLKIQVNTVSLISKYIFESIIYTNLFSVARYSGISKPVVRYLWNVLEFNKAKTHCPVGLYKMAGETEVNYLNNAKFEPRIDVFNDLSLEISVPLTPPGQILRFEIKTPDAKTFYVIEGSMKTDLLVSPGKQLKFSYVAGSPNGMFIIDNVAPITDNSINNYFSVKVKLENSFNSSLPSFSIEIKTIEEDSTITSTICSIEGVNFIVLKNYEYMDWKDSKGAHYYGQNQDSKSSGYIWAFAAHEALDSTAQTVDMSWFKKTFANSGSNYGYNGIPKKLSEDLIVKEIVINIKPSLNQICCAKSDNCLQTTSASDNCLLSTRTINNWFPSLYLGMVININIWKVDDTDGLGVKSYNWWNNGNVIYTKFNTDPFKKNFWDILDTGIGYLTYICKTDSNTNEGCGPPPITDLTTSTFGLLGIRSKIGSIYRSGLETVSQVYGAQYNLDIVVCFAYFIANDASAITTHDLKNYKLASSSLLNLFVLSPENQKDIRGRLINYVASTKLDTKKIPVFIRISGTLTKVEENFEALLVFLDDNLVLSKSKQQCPSSSDSMASCVFQISQKVYYGNPILSQRVDIFTTLNNKTIFNFYIPVEPNIDNSSPKMKTISIDVGLANIIDGYLSVKYIFRATGFIWGGEELTYFTTRTKAPVIGTAGTSYSALNCGIPQKQGFKENIEAGKTFSDGMLITSTLPTTNCLGSYNSATTVGKGGTAYTLVNAAVFLVDLVGSGKVTWLKTSTPCVKFSISSSIGFVCGIFKSDNSADVGSSSDISIVPFYTPWRWGALYSQDYVGTHISWSGGESGVLAAYFPHPTLSADSFQKECAIVGFQGYICKNKNMQRLSFTITPSSGLSMEGTSSGNDAPDLIFKVETKSSLGGFSVNHLCDAFLTSGTQPVECAAEFSNTIFKITINRKSSPTGIVYHNKSIASQPQTIYLYGNQNQNVWETTTAKSAEILYDDNIKVDSCVQTTSFSINFNPDENLILSISKVVYQKARSSRSPFQFSFGISFDSRQIWKGTSFVFNLGWLSDCITSAADNTHCFIRSGGKISFGWNSLDFTSISNPVLTAGKDIKYGVFDFVCNGGYSPNLNTQSNLKFTWKLDTLVLGSMDASSEIPPPRSFLDGRNDLFLKFPNKLWNDPGCHASYQFLVRPKNQNYTYESRIYVDFPRDIPPRGNAAGLPDCVINGSKIYCSYIDERRLILWPKENMLVNPEFPYEIWIHGIAQPKEIKTSSKIGITFDQDGDLTNGIGEWAEIIEKPSTNTKPFIIIKVNGIKCSEVYTRSKTNIEINITFPKETFSAEGKFYLEFPSYFADPLELNTILSCSMINSKDASQSELIQNCTQITKRIIRLYTNKDNIKDESMYMLTLSGFPTPNQPTPAGPNWITVFLASEDDSHVLGKSFPGDINASIFIFTHQPRKQVVDWYTVNNNNIEGKLQGECEVIVGTFRNKVLLRAETVAEVSYTLSPQGDTAKNLYLYPSVLKMNFGERDTSFLIGAKPGATQGRFLLSFYKSGDPYQVQTPIPSLPILVKSDYCIISPNLEIIKVPAGGLSFPIIFDFSSCMPVNDVTIVGTFIDTNKYNISFGPTEDDISQSQVLTFVNLEISSVSFTVKSFNDSQMLGSQTRISFNFSGGNQNAYKVERPVTIQLFDPTSLKSGPVVTKFKATPSSGLISLNIGCSTVGIIFFAIGLDVSVTSTALKSIKAASYDKQLKIKQRDASDRFWVVQGWEQQTSINPIDLTFKGVRSASGYYGVAWCQNQLEISNVDPGLVEWNQTDNGGRLGKLSLYFNKSITDSQEIDIACALSKLLKIPMGNVQTQTGWVCTNLRRIIQSTNSTSTSNSTTAKANETYIIHSWFVIPDYEAAISNFHLELSKLIGTDIISKIFALTNNPLSTFPTAQGYSINISTAARAPTPDVNILKPLLNVFERSLLFNITLNDTSGLVYYGVGAKSTVKPSGRPLKDGFDGQRTNLIIFGKQYCQAGITTLFELSSGLMYNNTDYKLYLALSSDDPSSEATFSEVLQIDFKTKKTSVFSLRMIVIYMFMTVFCFVIIIV